MTSARNNSPELSWFGNEMSSKKTSNPTSVEKHLKFLGWMQRLPGPHSSVFPELSSVLSKVKRIPAIKTVFNLHDGKSVVTVLLMSQQTKSHRINGWLCFIIRPVWRCLVVRKEMWGRLQSHSAASSLLFLCFLSCNRNAERFIGGVCRSWEENGLENASGCSHNQADLIWNRDEKDEIMDSNQSDVNEWNSNSQKKKKWHGLSTARTWKW